jgi:hypothetical protein
MLWQGFLALIRRPPDVINRPRIPRFGKNAIQNTISPL